MNKPIIVIGTGGFAREVGTLLLDLGLGAQWLAFVERDAAWKKGRQLMEKPVWKESEVDMGRFQVVIGVSDPRIREQIVDRLPSDTEYPTLIHPSAIYSRWVEVGKGTVICVGCVLTADIEIGNHVQLNLHTTIGHDVRIGDFVTTAPAVNISGNCQIGKGVYMGTQAATKQGISIGPGIILGMGAMAVKDLLEPGTYIGVPARKLMR